MQKHLSVSLLTLVALASLAFLTPACYRGGRIEVRAVPSQAYVYLDGAPVGDASLSHDRNLIMDGLTPGEHTVGIYNYGYKPEVQKVTVADGKTTHLKVALTPVTGAVSGPFGRIQIKGAPRAAVLLNGKTPEYLVGHVDEFNNNWHWKQELLVPPGTHQLTVLEGGNTVWSGAVTVAANQRVTVNVKQSGAQTTSNWPEGEKLTDVPRFQAGIASARVAVAKPTGQLSANPAEVNCGGSARLNWSTTDAVAGQISGLGDVPASGDREVQPKETTTYTLTAAGPGGSATSNATVNVNKTVQASLEVSPAEIRYERVGQKVMEQGTANVTWSTSNANSISVDPFESVNASGTRTVQAAPKQTTNGPVKETVTYTLKVSNPCGGSETRTATLHIVGSIKPGFTEAQVEAVMYSVYFPTAYPEKRAPEVGLLKSQKEKLTQFAGDFKKYIEVDPKARLRLDGNADTRGSKKYNLVLSERRVDVVKQFLISQGVPATAIDVKALGNQSNLDRKAVKQLEEKNPTGPTEKIVTRRPREDWLAHNRRVDIVLLPSDFVSSRFYPYAASDFMILWRARRPALKVIEKNQ